MSEQACRNCNFITKERTCPMCKGTSLSSDWSGYVIIIDPQDSEIAKKLNITKPGRYALKVR